MSAGHDLVVRGATVVDGTGAPGFEADVAVEGDRIVAVGSVAGPAPVELDGRGLVLAPGWIDTHTHLDANQFWDPFLTPCSRYGVTTVVLANCGYALAPVTTPEQREYVIEALVTVEQVPRDAIDEAVPFNWSDHASYVDALEQRRDRAQPSLPRRPPPGSRGGHGPRCGTHPRGDAGRDRSDARPRGRGAGARRVRVLDRPGGRQHRARQRRASGPGVRRRRAARVRRRTGRGTGPGAVHHGAARAAARPRTTANRPRMARATRRASGRPVVIGPVFDTYDEPGVGRDLLDGMAEAQARGHHVVGQVSPRPFELWTRLDASGVLVRMLPTLHAAVKTGGADAVRHLANDLEAMRRLRDEGAAWKPNLVFSGRWDHVHVRYSPRCGDLRDRDIATIAAATRRRPGRRLDRHGAHRRLRDAIRGSRCAAPTTIVSVSSSLTLRRSSAGASGRAHAEQHRQLLRGVDAAALGARTRRPVVGNRRCDAHRSTGRAVRHPRSGSHRPGLLADLVLFDPDRVGIDEVRYVSDMPAGGTRLVADPIGITASVVNGVVVTRDGELTGVLPGRLLRGG